MQLALRLGMPWEAFLDTVSSWEVAQWLALERVDPCIGTRRDDMRAALVATASFNAFGGDSKLDDWMLKFDVDPAQAEANRVALNEARLLQWEALHEQAQRGSDG